MTAPADMLPLVALHGLRLVGVVYCPAELAARFVVGWAASLEVAPGVTLQVFCFEKRAQTNGEVAVYLGTPDDTALPPRNLMQ